MTNTAVQNNQAIGGSSSGNGSIIEAGFAQGGAVASAGSSLEFAGCVFSNNQALGGVGGFGDGSGGAIFSNENLTVTVLNSAFTTNQAVGGAGSSNPSSFSTSGAVATGGAIDSSDDSLVTISGAVFKSNKAMGGAAGAVQSSSSAGGHSFRRRDQLPDIRDIGNRHRDRLELRRQPGHRRARGTEKTAAGGRGGCD